MFQLTLGRGEVTGQCYPRTIHNNIHLHWAFLICLGSLFSHGGCSLRHLDAAGLMGVVTHRIGHSTLWYDATMTGYIQLEDQRFNGFEAIQICLVY